MESSNALDDDASGRDAVTDDLHRPTVALRVPRTASARLRGVMGRSPVTSSCCHEWQVVRPVVIRLRRADWSTVLLRLSYLAMSGMFTVIRLLPVSGTEKDIEILALRHQLAVLQRQIDRPRFSDTDRAFLAALLHRLPRVRLRRLPLIVSPDAVLRWHPDLIRHRHATLSPQASRTTTDPPIHPGAGAAPGPGEQLLGIPGHPRRTRRSGDHAGTVHRPGDPQTARHRTRPRP